MSKFFARCIAVLLCVVAVLWDVSHRAKFQAARATWPALQTSAAKPPRALALASSGYIPMPNNTLAAHSSSLLTMPASHSSALMAFWFAGTKESAPDVRIAASAFDRVTRQWQPAVFVVDREALGETLGFGVRRLGNPVAWLDAHDRVHLFVVATGLGGWAASRVVHLRQNLAAQGLKFELMRVLPLSWLWNTSFLARTAPLSLHDGGMVLPVYFELGLKYPVALRFDAQGEFLGMVCISRRTHLLQPTLAMQSENQWLALMRDQRPDGRVAVAQTQDGGQSWVDLPDLTLTNPDASVAALGLAPGQMVMAHNASPRSRQLLDLSQSADGKHWERLARLASGSGNDEYSYPALAWAEDSLWVSYTDQRKRIAWQRFVSK